MEPFQHQFFEENHLEGDVKSKISFGLFLKDELVAAISLRIPFHKSYEKTIEIARFASKIDTHVNGGLSKLIKKCVTWARQSDFTSILSYVDTRFGTGIGYKTCGFVETGEMTSPRFWWSDGTKRIDRFYVKADGEHELTERDVASLKRVFRIFGCKNKKFFLHI